MYNGSTTEPYTDPGAPIHITTGAAGCREGLDGFIPKPSWSAFRNTVSKLVWSAADLRDFDKYLRAVVQLHPNAGAQWYPFAFRANDGGQGRPIVGAGHADRLVLGDQAQPWAVSGARKRSG